MRDYYKNQSLVRFIPGLWKSSLVVMVFMFLLSSQAMAQDAIYDIQGDPALENCEGTTVSISLSENVIGHFYALFRIASDGSYDYQALNVKFQPGPLLFGDYDVPGKYVVYEYDTYPGINLTGPGSGVLQNGAVWIYAEPLGKTLAFDGSYTQLPPDGGVYCSDGTLKIENSEPVNATYGSDWDVYYQLYDGGGTIGTPKTGNGGTLTWTGLPAGNYYVEAYRNSCTAVQMGGALDIYVGTVTNEDAGLCYVTIQDAIDDANAGNTIKVKAAYAETENVTIDKAITLYTGDANAIDGTLTVSAGSVTVDGFELDDVDITGGATITLTDNVFDNALTVSGGSGITLTGNDFNSGSGVTNTSGNMIDAEDNWWDNERGPDHGSNIGGGTRGVTVSDDVDFSPWWGNAGMTTQYAIPTQLVYTTQPGGAEIESNLDPQPVLEAQDASGILGYNYDGDVSMTLAPGSGTLNGTTPVTANDGVATFTDLSVWDDTGDFTVTASDDTYSLSSVESNTFTITPKKPIITDLDPHYKLKGDGAFQMTVTGQEFVSNSTVYFDGSLRPTTYVSATELTVDVPASDLTTEHTFDVTVVSDPGNVTSDPAAFEVRPVPDQVWVFSGWAGSTFDESVELPVADGIDQYFEYNAFSTINNGINAVAETGTVTVVMAPPPGGAPMYIENLIINKPLTLEGDLGPVMIWGAVVINADDVTIRDFAMISESMAPTSNVALSINGSNYTISNIGDISSLSTTNDNNIIIASAGNGTIENSGISGDTTAQGILITGTGIPTIQNCEFSGCEVAIFNTGNDDVEILNNQFVNNEIGIKNGSGANLVITGNNFNNTPNGGLAIDNNGGTGMVLRDNSFGGNTNAYTALNSDQAIDAIENWWGSSYGPTHTLNDCGDGNNITGTGTVTYDPWYYDNSMTTYNGLAEGVIMQDIPNISTVTGTPVVLNTQVSYPAILDNYDPGVMVDAVVTSNKVFPAGAQVVSVKYNGSELLTSAYSLAGEDEVYLSDLPGLSANPLAGHHDKNINWEITIDGFTVVDSYDATMDVVSYDTDKNNCNHVLTTDDFTISFDDATVEVTPASQYGCDDQASFTAEVNYPNIANLDEDVLADAKITSDVALTGGKITSITYDGGSNLLSTPYEFTGESSLYLSDILGTPPASLQGHSGLDSWVVTLEEIPAEIYNLTFEAIAELDGSEYSYANDNAQISFYNVELDNLTDIPDVSTITGTPVVIESTIDYPTIPAYGNEIVTDTKVELTTALPSGSQLIEVTYNGNDVPVTDPDISGSAEIYLSDHLAVDPTPLANHSTDVNNWTFTIDGVGAGTYPVTVSAIAYDDNNPGSCESIMGYDDFSLTFGEAIVEVTPETQNACDDEASFSANVTYPTIANMNTDVKVDAKITSDVPLTGGQITSITYDGTEVLGSPYNLSGSEFYLSTILGSSPASLQGHSGTDEWGVTITGIPAEIYNLTFEGMVKLDGTEYIYDDDDAQISFYNITGVGLSAIPDISTITGTPVIISNTISYPTIPAYGDEVVTDTKVTSDEEFPANAQLISVTYNGTEVLSSAQDISGLTEVYMSTLLPSGATPLANHSGQVNNWTFTIAGMDATETYNIDVSAIAYDDNNFGSCESELATESFALTLGESAVAVTPPVQNACGDEASFVAAVTYPTIANLNTNVLADARITSDVPIDGGEITSITYNDGSNLLSTPYDLTGAGTELYLSDILGSGPNSLQGHSGTDEWEVEVNGLDPEIYTLTFEGIALLDGVEYPHASGSNTMSFYNIDVTLSNIPDISTITGTPVIIESTIDYPEIPAYGDEILTDTRITLDQALPSGAELISVTYNDTEVLTGPEAIDGDTEIYMSDLLPSGATPLADHSLQSNDWTFTIAGIADPSSYTLTIEALAYEFTPLLNGTTCEWVMADQTFSLTFADATVDVTPEAQNACGDEATLTAVVTYPTIESLNESIKADALLTSDVAINDGEITSITYDGGANLLSTPYEFNGESSLYLSEILGTSPASLQGHSGTDTWQVVLSNVPAEVYTIDFDAIAVLEGDDYAYANDDAEVSFFNVEGVTITDIPDMSTIAETPVIIENTIEYPAIPNFGDDIVTDTKLELDKELPATAQLISVTYDNNEVLTTPQSLSGTTEIYMSDLLPSGVAPLDNHSLESHDWTFTVVGLNDIDTYEIDVSVIAYEGTQGACELVLASDNFSLTLGAATLAFTEEEIFGCQETATFTAEVGYPDIINLNDDIMADARIEVSEDLPAGTMITEVLYNGNSVLTSPYDIGGTSASTYVYLSDILGNMYPLSGHELTDVWEVTVDNLNANIYGMTMEAIARLDGEIYPYASDNANINVFNIQGVSMTSMDNIQTLTKTPVIVDYTIDYPTIPSYPDEVVTDAKLISDKNLPNTARITSVKYNDTEVLPSVYTFDGTQSEVYLSEILGEANPLADHSGISVDWEFTLDGFNNPETYQFTVIGLSYYQQGTCENTISFDQFDMQFDDGTLAIEEGVESCDELVTFDITETFPYEIQGVHTDIKADARFKSDIEFPTGAEITSLTYDGGGNLISSSYGLSGTDWIYLSDVLGNMNPLNGHSGTDVWSITIDGMTPDTYTLTVEGLARLNTDIYTYNSDVEGIDFWADPTVSLSPAFSDVCEGDNVDVELTLTGEFPIDVTYTFNSGTPVTVDDIASSPHTINVGPIVTGNNTIEVTNIVDANTCSGAGASTTVNGIADPAPTISGEANPLEGSTELYEVGSVDPTSTYTWNVTGEDASYTGGPYNNICEVTWGAAGSGTVELTEVNTTGCSTTETLNVTIEAIALKGTITYNNSSNTPMNGVTVNLKDGGTTVQSTTTDPTGYYHFNTLTGVNYTLELSTDKLWGGANSTDALGIERYSIGTTFGWWTPELFVDDVADVNNSTLINATDALLVKRRAIQLVTSFIAGDWDFYDVSGDQLFTNTEDNTAELSYTHSSAKEMNIEAMCYGDVTGSYNPSATKTISPVRSDYIVQVLQGKAFELPVKISEEAELGAMTVYLKYNERYVKVRELKSDLEDLIYNVEDGWIKVAWTDLDGVEIPEGGTLFTMVVEAKDVVNHNRDLFKVSNQTQFADVDVNVLEGIEVTIDELDVKKAIADNIQEFYSISSYPNPVKDHSTINYALPEAGAVLLEVTNSYGEVVTKLVDQNLEAGNYSQKFFPEEHNLGSGVYYLRFTVDGESADYTDVVRVVYVK